MKKFILFYIMKSTIVWNKSLEAQDSRMFVTSYEHESNSSPCYIYESSVCTKICIRPSVWAHGLHRWSIRRTRRLTDKQNKIQSTDSANRGGCQKFVSLLHGLGFKLK